MDNLKQIVKLLQEISEQKINVKKIIYIGLHEELYGVSKVKEQPKVGTKRTYNKCTAYEISVQENKIIKLLNDEGSMTPKEIAEELKINKKTIYNRLIKLDAKNHHVRKSKVGKSIQFFYQ